MVLHGPSFLLVHYEVVFLRDVDTLPSVKEGFKAFPPTPGGEGPGRESYRCSLDFLFVLLYDSRSLSCLAGMETVSYFENPFSTAKTLTRFFVSLNFLSNTEQFLDHLICFFSIL